MPHYVYRCEKQHEYEVWRSMHEDVGTHRCPTCELDSIQVFFPPQLYAVGERGAHTRATDATEKQWDKDMPAYRRLRHAGHQPQGIDGAAKLEATAEHGMEVNSKGIVKGPEHRIREAMELARDITGGRA